MKKKYLKEYIPLIVLMIVMYAIHRYIFIYADDLYYSRDAQRGFSYLPEFMIGQLNINGRVWVHVLLMYLVKYDVLVYRIINPIIIVLAVFCISKISTRDSKNKSIFATSIIGALLFIALPRDIASTTIYYAACSLNYFYPTLVSILFGYTILNYYSKGENFDKLNILILILAFFSGSSTQQAGAIGIGFAVLTTLYLIFIKKYKIKMKYYLNFIPLIIGYGLVSYGSVKRMLFEKSSGVEIKVTDTITEILKTNIFSKPMVLFVILILVCCIIWILKFNSGNNYNKYLKYFNFAIVLAILVSILCYIYVVILKGYKVEIFTSTNASLKIKLFYLGFTSIYILSMLYVGGLILAYKDNPFILSCMINAIGAQIMLIVADARFASTYKIIFPSLMLMFIFITYTFNEIYNDKFRLSKVTYFAFVLVLLFSAFLYYRDNYLGYRRTSVEVEYNLKAIEEYQASNDKSKLTLKKVPPSLYGYNLGNWNTMPYFMKQCYRISEDTIIEYID